MCWRIIKYNNMLRTIKDGVIKLHDFLIDKERLEVEVNWIRKVWYVILVIGTSIYVLCHFKDLIHYSFLKHFDGKSLIFVIWLILLLLPLFESFEGFGVSINRQKEMHKQLSNNLDKAAQDVINNTPSEISLEELRDRLNQLSDNNDA